MPRFACLLAFLATPALLQPALAQSMTTAAEVRPILDATKPQWIAVREFDGQDLLYFTNLLAWRCGVTAVSYGLNGAPADTPFQMEPCYEGEAAPNAFKAEDGGFIYLTQPLGSITSVTVSVTYDDGSTDTAEYERKAVLMP